MDTSIERDEMITGKDLQDWGMMPGPIYKTATKVLGVLFLVLPVQCLAHENFDWASVGRYAGSKKEYVVITTNFCEKGSDSASTNFLPGVKKECPFCKNRMARPPKDRDCKKCGNTRTIIERVVLIKK
jgi:hypothetical protein